MYMRTSPSTRGRNSSSWPERVLKNLSICDSILKRKARRPTTKRENVRRRASELFEREVVREYAGDLYRLSRKPCRCELRLPRRLDRRLSQQRVPAHGLRRNHIAIFVHDDLHGHSALSAHRLPNRRVRGFRLADGLAVQDAAGHDDHRLRYVAEGRRRLVQRRRGDE